MIPPRALDPFYRGMILKSIFLSMFADIFGDQKHQESIEGITMIKVITPMNQFQFGKIGENDSIENGLLNVDDILILNYFDMPVVYPII